MELALKRSQSKLAMILDEGGETVYCCIECPARYTDKDKLELHLCSEHNREYRYLCGTCGTGLKRKEHLDRHLLGHQEVRPHVCPDCGKGFKRKEHLNIHRSIHSGDKSQFCPICHRSFYRKDHLQKHLQTHAKGCEVDLGSVKLEPQDDTLQLDKDAYMEQQANENIQIPIDRERPFACEICHKTYKRRDHLKLHSYTHMEKDKVCSECGKAFHKEEQLLAHMTVHLQQTVIHRVSDEDGPLTMDADSLLVPRGRKPADAEARPHACRQCGRRFKRRQHLKVHANVHRPSPTIWCSLCSDGFRSNAEFEQHECLAQNGDHEVYHDEADTEAYHMEGETYTEEAYQEDEVYDNSQDEGCSYPNGAEESSNADYENNMPEHFEMMSVENLTISPLITLQEERHIPTPQRVYVCKYCSKPFKRKDHYKIHLHIHTGIRSFFCTDCGKGFYRKDHLQKHSLVHFKARTKPQRKLPALYPISMLGKRTKPEITITAPMNTKLRVPLQIKVPYQMVTATPSGEQRAVTITPQ